MEDDYIYDGKFSGNILVVGRTGCCMATFLQQLGKNNLFGTEITRFLGFKNYLVEWEDAIRESFKNQDVHFNYPNDLDDFIIF